MYSIFQRTGDLKSYYKNSPVTSIIIILNTLVFLATFILDTFTSISLNAYGAINQILIMEFGEWYRIFTAAFLHGSFLHYASNIIIGLYVLSAALEKLIGSKKFSIVYFGSLILSGLLVTFLSDPLTFSLGASGAIFGALGSLLYITLYRKDMLHPRDIQSIQGLIVVNIIFTFVWPNISIWGHVGGIISGFLLSYLLIKRDIFKVIN